MKFIHLGDLHLGKLLADFNLIEDQQFILQQIIEIATEHNVDAFLIAGDIYDKAIPSEAAVRLYDQFLTELAQKHFQVFMISGNHDSDERLNCGKQFFAAKDVYISAKYGGELPKITCTDAYGPLHIYLMPFMKASQVRHFYPDADITNYDQAVRVVIETAKVDPEERNILVAHQFVGGRSEDIVLAGSEGISVQNVGAVEMIGADAFSMFDYVALGHIHAPQKVGREAVRYSGSPLKYSLSEVNNHKSVPIVTIGAKGTVAIELISLKPLRDLRHIKGPMDQLLAAEHLSDTNDYIYVTLTDEDPILDAMAVFQQYYPNTVKIDYDNARTRELEQVDFGAVTKEKTFEEMFGEFYEKMYGHAISEEEMIFMQKVAREAGVIHEAD